MNLSTFESNGWKWFFWSLFPLYALCYAPYGVNETDGGFITGLAWQLLSGKVLYQDIVYIRPPIPVFLRALELKLLPEYYAVLGERWIFYLKVWLYSYMAARLLMPNPKKWILATIGFIVSVHCYPAMAWHTVDGIFFAVLSAYLWFCSPLRYQGLGFWLAGSAAAISMLCKQSFYPLLPFFGVAMYLDHQSTGRQKLLFAGGVASALALWWVYLAQAGLSAMYMSLTAGSTTTGQAVQHGLFDYWMI
ncbi:MAG: hypothetical protein JNJ57_01910, partial [Saprospiraceae bacterium]|nr:hypothetical protein [Saprospiraceae bacterium]